MDSKITSNDGDQTLHSEVREVDSLPNAIGTMSHEKARSLLKNGADPNDPEIKSKYRETLLHIAVKNDDPKSVNILLEYGARINETDNLGRTALDIAVQHNDLESVNILLQHGARINETDNLGRTALDIAVQHNDLESVNILLQHGARINETDNFGRTALQIAQKSYDCRIPLVLENFDRDFLEDFDGHCITSNSTELTKDSTEQVQEILDPKFILGWRFLYLVAHSDVNEVETFLHKEPDIDINYKDKEGRTALQIAQENGNDEMFFFLSVIKGADTSFLDTESEKEGANTGVLDTELEQGYIYSEEEGTESEEEGAKANTSDRTNSNSTKSTESPSTNPTNPKEEEQLVTKNQAGRKRSFSEIS